jgi:hypothetical protein
VSCISYRLGSGRGSSLCRFLLIIESQSAANFRVGDALVGLGQSGPRRLDVDAILFCLDQPIQQLHVLDRNNGSRVLPSSVDNNPLPLILCAVQHLGKRLSKLDHTEAHHSANSKSIPRVPHIMNLKNIMYMMNAAVKLGKVVEQKRGPTLEEAEGDLPQLPLCDRVEEQES